VGLETLANGALTNRQSATGSGQYEYDCAGRLTYSQQSTADSLSLTYDALGNRLTTYAANATSIWITDHADPRKRPLMEADSNGVPVRYFIWGENLLLAVVEADGTMRYCHSDDQGSVVALTDNAGNVTDQYCYGPYGTDWGRSGTNSIPFRWLGSHGVLSVANLMPLPSSLYLTRHRAYDAELGRFLSADPSGLAGGPNLYAYCLGNPLAYVDPLGLCGESIRARTWQDDVNAVFAYTGWVGKNIAEMAVSPFVSTYQASDNFWSDPTPANAVNYALATGLGLMSVVVPEANVETRMTESVVANAAERAAAKSESGLVNLADSEGTAHILDRHGPDRGMPGKSEFPASWSDDRVLHEVSDIATDPAVTWSRPDARGYVTTTKMVDGVNVKVVYDTVNKRIVTGFPTKQTYHSTHE